MQVFCTAWRKNYAAQPGGADWQGPLLRRVVFPDADAGSGVREYHERIRMRQTGENLARSGVATRAGRAKARTSRCDSGRVSAAAKPPPSYAETVRGDLDQIAEDYRGVLSASAIVNVDPNNWDSSFIFVGAAEWGWVDSDSELDAARMKLLARLRDWWPRFRLLFPHPTSEVERRLDDAYEHLERWLVRKRSDTSIPASIEKASALLDAKVEDLGRLLDMLPGDDYPVRLVVDTNALIDNPDLAAYIPQIGQKYIVHLLPVVLGELDDLKCAGKVDSLRNAARAAERRLKGIRNNGDPRVGVRVAGQVVAKFEHVEPRARGSRLGST